jgi:hypothetical protein
MNLDTSVNTMNIQSSIKEKECEDIIFQDATQTHKRWSDLPTSQHTTSVGEGILQGVMSRINHYVAKLVSKQTETSRFQVCYTNTRTVDIEVKELPGTISNMGNDTENEKKDSLCDTVPLSPIPIFSRIRSVNIDQTGTMFCSCKHFKRTGLPCVHMACVAKLCHETSVFGSHTSKFSGFTHHDIAVRWWSSYMYYAYRSSTPSHNIEKYHLLAMNPIKGPKMRFNVPQFLEIYDEQQNLSAIDHLKNYPRNFISQSQVKESILSKTIIHISLTNNDDIENGIITYVDDKWKEGSGRHMNDLFSQSIMNSDFYSPQKVGSVQARSSLKQLWEECCAEADEIGPEGVRKLED